jgi:hypothetical protein
MEILNREEEACPHLLSLRRPILVELSLDLSKQVFPYVRAELCFSMQRLADHAVTGLEADQVDGCDATGLRRNRAYRATVLFDNVCVKRLRYEHGSELQVVQVVNAVSVFRHARVATRALDVATDTEVDHELLRLPQHAQLSWYGAAELVPEQEQVLEPLQFS